jgi:hypothetical protein
MDKGRPLNCGVAGPLIFDLRKLKHIRRIAPVAFLFAHDSGMTAERMSIEYCNVGCKPGAWRIQMNLVDKYPQMGIFRANIYG